ncbi:putative RNA recognition motif domain, nucleotide-binding alpha-beta plait domain superfamily [Helianthus annuus]|uniref:Putative nucleotide-binding alpha-beta plait domain-containing protein n=1 Tax=Helianthus annuus TaxID=4232 RepID=A0A251TPB6_HELAN|nr:putative RNA recognition motif domain, nucleotide-binding alpha-beta plait domain superfamily [Helianthus annuus]KAJ0514879.1 putative RNA recognition motif domain, nucleotide-binding alpha-beta plait domain superfamily [Helianthus annuus]KAJ0523200.1 putative RNA recognition motif domain, nucleotide-binding alpha-beta plait domain superfamily [Helianthus annuus]KAJ0531043.1 putative RNA recognition motif domain, nucleotide-binding alpha-beta plait domain superfamily [Helianthus annuus]KAJ06
MRGFSRFNVDEWYDVPSRKGKDNRDHRRPSNEVITKSFVSNLPPKCSSVDLLNVFKGFGDYVGSYIARKSDRLGKKFGFLSFRNVKDVKRLEADLVDVWMGSYKLFVARARFVDGERVVGGSDGNKDKNLDRTNEFMAEKEASHEGHANPNQGGVASRVGENSRSYRDTFLNKNVVVNLDSVLKIDDSVEGYRDWHKLSVCVRVKNYKVLSSLVELLKTSGGCSAEIKYGGGFNVMLIFNDDQECTSFLDNKDVWAEWFESAERWSGQVLKYERIAWLRVHGVPISLAVDQVFEAVGKRYGMVVQPACYSSDEKDFSYTYIGVLCGRDSRVDDRFSLSWRDKIFKVWVDEDVEEWSPDCIEVIEDCEMEDSSESKSDGNDCVSGYGFEVEMGEVG